ncbi:MAG: YigZ family protein [Clostridiales bacterium GWC2_40_7]|nr:MAG: YigZ family protein [Clostridiales bacterium GWC2_40_7]
MQKEYRTISTEASAEFEEKKSRFIACARPVTSEEEAAAFINRLKSKYWNATHNVYAYYICGINILQKFSDDGEPSGTAGMPVLEAVKKLMVQDIAVVVTRYFGGTLLGAAGLVRAYGKSATMGIEAAGIIKRQLCIRTDIILEYTLLGKVQSMLGAKRYLINEISYGQDVQISCSVPVDEYELFVSELTEATNARALVNEGEKEYITVFS